MTTETQNPLEAALLSIITNTTQAVGKGIDFLSEQIPDVIHQLLVWEASKAGIIAFCWIVVAGVLITISTKLYKFSKSHVTKSTYDERKGFGYFCSIITGILSVGALSGMVVQLLIVVQIWLAPKIFLIQYAASLVRG